MSLLLAMMLLNDPCTVLLPHDDAGHELPLPACKEDGAWEECPTVVLTYADCEIDLLRAQLGDLEKDLKDKDTAQKTSDLQVAFWKGQYDDAQRHEDSIQTRSTLATVFAAAGGAGAAGGTVAAASGHVPEGLAVAAGGAALFGIAFLLTR